MDKPVIKSSIIIKDIPRAEGNPRNSEGDFAVLNDGSVLFAWCRYHGDSAHDDAACDIAGALSEDGGESFKMLPYPLAEAKAHGVKNIMSVSLTRLKDGTLCLFYLCKKTPMSEVYLRRALPDEKHFGEAELCYPIKNDTYYVINNCRICVLSSGEVIIPTACHPIKNGSGSYFGKCRMFVADENCRKFNKTKLLALTPRGYSGTGLQEPGVVELPDGRLYAYFRTDRCFQYESFSADKGQTWSKPVPSHFTSPDSPMLILRNPYSGIYYALWNPVPNYNGRIDPTKRWVNAGRTPFVLAQSENGLDFSEYVIIEDDPEHGYCYPAICFIDEKTLLLSYCCGGPEDGMCLTRTRIRKITLE